MPDATPPHTLYHLNPFAAGPLARWPGEFARIAALGFEGVVLAPPFASAPGQPWLLRDPTLLHPTLGEGEALPALRAMADAARAEGLALLLDVRAGAVARGAALPAALPPTPDMPPDPRHPPGEEEALPLPSPPPAPLAAWWAARLEEWHAAGIAGFRCLDPAWGGDFWRGRIAALPGALFIAWAPGLPASAQATLAGAGFGLVASSLPWWDFRAGWWAEEVARLAAVAPLLSVPEAPFGPRLAAAVAEPEAAARLLRRALSFAALSGTAWMMPMGMEFGALHRATASAREAEHFAALRAAPRLDLRGEVRAANRARRAQPAATGRAAPVVLSAPQAPVVLLREGAAGERLLVVANPSARQGARLSAGQVAGLLPRPALWPRKAFGAEGVLELGPAETRMLRLTGVEPARHAAPPVEAALHAERIAIEAVQPAVDGGRFAVKRPVGQAVRVTADLFAEGHGRLAARLQWRAADEALWAEVPMRPEGNDLWAASFVPARVGRHVFRVIAWIDHFAAFREEIGKKHAAGLGVALEQREGLALLEAALPALPPEEAAELRALAGRIATASAGDEAVALFTTPRLGALMAAADARPFLAQSAVLPLEVERRGAGFAAWYEIFPRSQSGSAARHGTWQDVIRALPRVRDMGFDVLYFPPIHPIGRSNRKGRNNSLVAQPGDPGSPYAIGAAEGGHDAIHPELGTLEEFLRLVAAARENGLEIALDFAIQCSPDHPWLRDHPEWFAWRPDGSIRYAENPPKKYEDIVNVEFYAEGARPALWLALRDVVLFWVAQGVRLFRVDNPHTKPLPFWEWLIADVRGREPDVVFLSEAFTRPKLMYRLAKLGFSQSYSYFTWRNSAAEMRAYLEELNRPPVADFFRPHFFVNTPDINPVFLQENGRAGHLIRAALAATLSGLWGVYNGFELCEARPVPGKEEYLDSEKYEIRAWDYDRPGHIAAEITLLNRLRRENPALQTHLGVTFLPGGHDALLAYVKATPGRENILLVVVSMEPRHAVESGFAVPRAALGLPEGTPLLAENLIQGGEEAWHGPWRPLRLDPHQLPFAIWRLRAADKA
ncbi:alpha-1,4-glucan--maltose-1-phosphate maltosyltransferase [Roseomonas sp. GC11]|uniref:alpha-1,4-glucan--maltose-1-phosphate maltosyltransferase n=1 Tax=Roseomonas sp. GC11 TaxID=2950546 RepID=UPI0021092474|nr:alpha-1,4-glucan--maltose-1-phosphate maltosyltransferase [Roseomonas sp. GC11]MCQ4158438.1 alpha-1,4-glucan--maltose-1-phosphate maltosyltransferase [Roseomonas sp. GC11]